MTATPKQISYLKSLVLDYYNASYDKGQHIIARLTASDCKLSKRDASRAIAMMAPICKVYAECYRRIERGQSWESYFRANVGDAGDDRTDKELDRIFATA